MLAAYALGALEPDEREFVARNVPRFPEWQKELDGYRIATTGLAHAAEPMDVPVRVRAAVLAEVDAIESNVPLKRYRKAAWNATLPALELPEPKPEGRNWKRTIPRVALITSMPATVVAIVFAMYTIIIHDQITEQQHEIAEFQQAQDESAEVLISPPNERQVIDLNASNDAPFARGSLFVDQSENTAMLVARNLPVLAEDEQYVVWVQTGVDDSKEFARIGVLEPNDSGTDQIVIDPPELFERYSNVLVTRETNAESIVPTGPSILTAGI